MVEKLKGKQYPKKTMGRVEWRAKLERDRDALQDKARARDLKSQKAEAAAEKKGKAKTLKVPTKAKPKGKAKEGTAKK